MRSEPLDCRAPQARPPSLDRVETGNAPREIRTGNRPVNRLRSTRPTLDRVAVFGEEDSSTTADKTMFVARSGRTHLRKFASRRKARRTTRPRYRSPSSTLTGMVGRASPCPGAAPPRCLISSRSRGDRHGQLCREAHSPPDTSTSVVRVFAIRPTGLPADSGPWTAVCSGA